MAGIHNVLAGLGSRLQVTITLAANQTNYVLNTAKVAGYIPGFTDVTVVVNAGVIVSANSTAVHAFDVDTSWHPNDDLTLVNNGTIVGMGGAGGAGRNISGSSPSGGSAGAFGGPGFRAQRPIKINNGSGTMGGGGGGGGGGGSGSGFA